MPKVYEIAAISPSVIQRTIAELQDQMARYSQAAMDLSSQANASYKALQAAIQSSDVFAAREALDELERDTSPAVSAGAPTMPPPSPVATNTSGVPVEGGPNESNTTEANPAQTGSVDTFA